MKELQKRIDEYYQKENWPYWNQHEILARLTEEVGELAREKKKSDEAANTIEAEVGDILYALACLANSENFSLQEALEKSINKVETRDKGRFTQKDS